MIFVHNLSYTDYMARTPSNLHYVPLIVEMYQQRKLSIPEINELTGVSRSTVRRILVQKGVTMRPRGKPKKGSRDVL